MVPDIKQLIGSGGATAQCILGGLCIEGLGVADNEGPVALGLVHIRVGHLLGGVSTPFLHRHPECVMVLSIVRADGQSYMTCRANASIQRWVQ